MSGSRWRHSSRTSLGSIASNCRSRLIGMVFLYGQNGRSPADLYSSILGWRVTPPPMPQASFPGESAKWKPSLQNRGYRRVLTPRAAGSAAKICRHICAGWYGSRPDVDTPRRLPPRTPPRIERDRFQLKLVNRSRENPHREPAGQESGTSASLSPGAKDSRRPNIREETCFEALAEPPRVFRIAARWRLARS